MEVSLRVMSLETRVYLHAAYQTGLALSPLECPLSLRGFRTQHVRSLTRCKGTVQRNIKMTFICVMGWSHGRVHFGRGKGCNNHWVKLVFVVVVCLFFKATLDNRVTNDQFLFKWKYIYSL